MTCFIMCDFVKFLYQTQWTKEATKLKPKKRPYNINYLSKSLYCSYLLDLDSIWAHVVVANKGHTRST